MNRRSVVVGALAASAVAACTPEPPEAPRTLVDVARADGRFNTLLTVMEIAGLTPTLAAPGPFTLFAPTDTAFAQAPQGAVAQLMQTRNRAQLATLMAYHLVAGQLTTADIPLGRSQVVSLQGTPLSLEWNGLLLSVNGALASRSDVTADNGVIHAVNQVLLP
ncbi:fasciclin domain-containing protein [Halovulum marinum]|nr:fasciclin domain-containing protein [Halovulum marinum]